MKGNHTHIGNNYYFMNDTKPEVFEMLSNLVKDLIKEITFNRDEITVLNGEVDYWREKYEELENDLLKFRNINN